MQVHYVRRPTSQSFVPQKTTTKKNSVVRRGWGQVAQADKKAFSARFNGISRDASDSWGSLASSDQREFLGASRRNFKKGGRGGESQGNRHGLEVDSPLDGGELAQNP